MQALAFIFAAATTVTQPLSTGTDKFNIQFSPRTPEQIASFYIARGFPEDVVNILKQQCFITIRIHNTGTEKLWLNLANWKFTANGKPLHRDHRDVWKQRWSDMGLPLRFQSTFRWTLLPESLDYVPQEEEGGNIILPRVKGPISLQASFITGNNKQGPVINIEYDKLYCAEDPQ